MYKAREKYCGIMEPRVGPGGPPRVRSLSSIERENAARNAIFLTQKIKELMIEIHRFVADIDKFPNTKGVGGYSRNIEKLRRNMRTGNDMDMQRLFAYMVWAADKPKGLQNMFPPENIELVEYIIVDGMHHIKPENKVRAQELYDRLKVTEEDIHYKALGEVHDLFLLLYMAIENDIKEGVMNPQVHAPRNIIPPDIDNEDDIDFFDDAYDKFIDNVSQESYIIPPDGQFTTQEFPCLPGLTRKVRGWRLMNGARIGRGSFGKVYRVCNGDNDTSCNYVLKKGNVKKEELDFQTRAAAVGSAKPIRDAWRCMGEDSNILVTDFVPMMMLRVLNKIADEKIAWTLMKKTMLALMRLHVHGRILHGDIKGDNIMVDTKGDPYIIDFGMSEEMYTDRDSNGSDRTYLNMGMLYRDWKDCAVMFRRHALIAKEKVILIGNIAIACAVEANRTKNSLRETEEKVVNMICGMDDKTLREYKKQVDESPLSLVHMYEEEAEENGTHQRARDYFKTRPRENFSNRLQFASHEGSSKGKGAEEPNSGKFFANSSEIKHEEWMTNSKSDVIYNPEYNQ